MPDIQVESVKEIKNQKIGDLPSTGQQWLKKYLAYLITPPLKMEDKLVMGVVGSGDTTHNALIGLQIPETFRKDEDFRSVKHFFDYDQRGNRPGGFDPCFDDREGVLYFHFLVLFWLLDQFPEMKCTPDYQELMEQFLRSICKKKDVRLHNITPERDIEIQYQHIDTFLPNASPLEKVTFVWYLGYQGCFTGASSYLNWRDIDRITFPWSTNGRKHLGIFSGYEVTILEHLSPKGIGKSARKRQRDDFSPTTRKLMAERVNYLCSKPDCRRQTSGPHSDPNKRVIEGRAAHITAAASGGPRYDPTLTPDQRKSIENGIWLCTIDADLVDADDSPFPELLLREWKRDAEADALAAIQSSPKNHIKPKPELVLQSRTDSIPPNPPDLDQLEEFLNRKDRELTYFWDNCPHSMRESLESIYKMLYEFIPRYKKQVTLPFRIQNIGTYPAEEISIRLWSQTKELIFPSTIIVGFPAIPALPELPKIGFTPELYFNQIRQLHHEVWTRVTKPAEYIVNEGEELCKISIAKLQHRDHFDFVIIGELQEHVPSIEIRYEVIADNTPLPVNGTLSMAWKKPQPKNQKLCIQSALKPFIPINGVPNQEKPAKEPEQQVLPTTRINPSIDEINQQKVVKINRKATPPTKCPECQADLPAASYAEESFGKRFIKCLECGWQKKLS